MSGGPATITSVIAPPTGGIHVPTGDEMRLLAQACETLAEDAVCWAAIGVRVLADPDLLASAAVSPPTFAEAEAAVIEATIGPFGLSKTRWSLAAVAEAVRLFDAAFPEVDQRIASRFAGFASLLYGHETGVALQPIAAPCVVAPHDLPSLLTDLESVAHGAPGAIAIETITAPDGSRRHVVLLPGTNDMTTLPGLRDAVLRDMDENVRLVAGEGTAYTAGVLTALADAGIEPGEPILIAGHSQGGMVAIAVATAASALGYRVTTVVTAGAPAPLATKSPPHTTTVLALENDGDIVPLTDGAKATATPGKTTVVFDSGPDTIVGSHRLEHYVEGAESIEGSADPRVRHAVGVVDAFLDVPGATATTDLYVLTRD